MDEDVFVGEYDRSVDSNGRVALPSMFRDLLGERCYATRDPQGCIVVRTAARYSRDAKRIAKQEERGDVPRGTGRSLSTRTVIVGVDKQGRVTLDEPNRTFAAIDAGGHVMVIGNAHSIELWRPSRWSVVASEDSSQEPDRVWPDEIDAA